MSRAVTSVVQRVSMDLGEYRWEDWKGVTIRNYYSWDLVLRSTGASALCVWYLVRREMGSTAGTVSLGCTLGSGTVNCFWNRKLLTVSQGAGSLGTLGVVWGGMGCCGLG